MGQPFYCIPQRNGTCAVIVENNTVPFITSPYKTERLKPLLYKHFSQCISETLAAQAFQQYCLFFHCTKKKQAYTESFIHAVSSDFFTCFSTGKKILLEYKTVYICPT